MEYTLSPKRTQKKAENSPHLQSVIPRTRNQNTIFKEFEKRKNLFIHGCAGTGKSYLGCYLAIKAVENGEYNKLVIIRSAVPSRKQGFLPGSPQEKDEIYEIPYTAIFDKLYMNDKHYAFLKTQDKINFVSTSYLRGTTIDNAIILADEIQNMNFMEINTIMTRIGENSKIIVCGDGDQDDLSSLNEDSCINDAIKIFSKMPSFNIIEMEENDILRSGIVKEWIIAKKNIYNKPNFLLK